MGKHPNFFQRKQSFLSSGVTNVCKHKTRALTEEERFGVLCDPSTLDSDLLKKLKINEGDRSDAEGNTSLPEAKQQHGSPGSHGLVTENFTCAIIPGSHSSSKINHHNQRIKSSPRRTKYSRDCLMKLRHNRRRIPEELHHRHSDLYCRCGNIKQYSEGQLLTLRHGRTLVNHRPLPCCKYHGTRNRCDFKKNEQVIRSF